MKVSLKLSQKTIELCGLILLGLGLALYMASNYSLKPYSDPHQWYCFGKNFISSFAVQDIPYAYPFVIWLAIQVVGPYYAFLVNIPILVMLVVALYYFAKRHYQVSSRGDDTSAVMCGIVAVCFYLFVAKDMLLYLANPYRDPFSFLMVLAGYIGVVHFRMKEVPATRHFRKTIRIRYERNSINTLVIAELI